MKTAKHLHIVTDDPVVIRRYPPEARFNPDVLPADWPFSETKKRPGDVVISLAVTPTRKGQDRATGLGSWVARLSSKRMSNDHP